MTIEEVSKRITKYANDNNPSVIFLIGNLGAGKTHLVNYLANKLGMDKHLPSPTFTFLQVYDCNWESFKRLIHCDFYRIENDKAEKTLEQIGFWDFLEQGSLIFIEWPENVSPILDSVKHSTVTISLNSKGERDYEFK